MSSSCSKALGLAEIVSSIFDAICDEPRYEFITTLLSCTFVNTVWHEEANRCLWNECGATVDYRNIPRIEDLLALDDQQKFANYIKRIHLCYADLSGDEFDWGGRFLPDLAKLSFPRLEELDLEAPLRADKEIYPPPAVMQFVQPKLRIIRISADACASSFSIPEEWFNELAQHSRGLLYFCFTGTDQGSRLKVTPVALTSFFESMQSLRRLDWEGDMSEDAFIALGQINSLLRFSMPSIHDTWLDDRVRTAPSGSLFRNLSHLSCGISADGLSNLAPHLRMVHRLSLKIADNASKGLRVLSRASIAKLMELRLQVSFDDSIQAEDLLEFARTSPELLVLNVGWRPEHYGIYAIHNANSSSLQNMDDNAMETLASSLPRLLELRLVSISGTEMTELSLLSLGRHCPSLTICALSTIVHYGNLVQQSRSGGIEWRRLQKLFISGAAIEPDQREQEALLALSQGIKDRMPSLESVSLQSNPNLEKTLRDMLSPRQGMYDGSEGDDSESDDSESDDSESEID